MRPISAQPQTLEHIRVVGHDSVGPWEALLVNSPRLLSAHPYCPCRAPASPVVALFQGLFSASRAAMRHYQILQMA